MAIDQVDNQLVHADVQREENTPDSLYLEPTPRIRQNPYYNALVAQGADFSISERLALKGEQADSLTGLPVENDRLRLRLAQELSMSIRQGKDWFLVYSDVDNLKAANNINRDLGDISIAERSSTICRAVSESLLPETTVAAVRQTHAADETVLWGFDLNPEEKKRMTERLSTADSGPSITQPPFTFSSSTIFLSSDDERIQNRLEDTRRMLQEDPENIAINFYQDIKDLADLDVKLIKVLKDLERLKQPGDKLFSTKGLNEFTQVMVDEFGGTRISKPLLKALLRLQSVEAVLALKDTKDYTAVLHQFGINETDLDNANSLEAKFELFRKIFGTLQ